MSSYTKSKPDIEDINAWLNTLYDEHVVDLSPLTGGFWSSAYAYQVGSNPYVLRFNESAEGFMIDQAAMRFKRPGLPIPNVLQTGEALGLQFAISERHSGRFLELAQEEEGAIVGNALYQLLHTMGTVSASPEDPVVWYDPGSSESVTWHSWLKGGLTDNPDHPAGGWRQKLAAKTEIDAIFKQCESRIGELLPLCPERRDLIHGDLLHQNVLISDDGTEVTGIFSWKCSALGDFLYDVAWCTFWSNWFPWIKKTNILNRTLSAPNLSQKDLLHAAERHLCYELQIGASHLGWFIWVEDNENLERVAAELETRLAVN